MHRSAIALRSRAGTSRATRRGRSSGRKSSRNARVVLEIGRSSKRKSSKNARSIFRTGRPSARNPSPNTSRAFRAGRLAAKNVAASNPSIDQRLEAAAINRAWWKYRHARGAKVSSWKAYRMESRSFIRGYCRGAQRAVGDLVMLPTSQSVAAVITARNEQDTLRPLLQELNRSAFKEIIVVVNGSGDDSLFVARDAGATIVHYPEPLGHDIGRAVGAKLSQSDIVLFLDGDMPIRVEELMPFVYAVSSGYDIALNNLRPYIGPLRNWDHVTLLKEFINRSMDREDLSANSLTAVPHAMSRSALLAIGVKELAVPPRAQIIALFKRLKICAPASINVITRNKLRQHNVGTGNPVSELILGDHLEALQQLRGYKGRRMGFHDFIRKRELAGGIRR